MKVIDHLKKLPPAISKRIITLVSISKDKEVLNADRIKLSDAISAVYGCDTVKEHIKYDFMSKLFNMVKEAEQR